MGRNRIPKCQKRGKWNTSEVIPTGVYKFKQSKQRAKYRPKAASSVPKHIAWWILRLMYFYFCYPSMKISKIQT